MSEQNLLTAVNIPPRFANATFESFVASTPTAKHNLKIC
ncbi:TPA: DNA replication protein DnaC, partial [Proteus mirabilis]|nr:DNA replication protein DnaC [Proteus mirabilis]